MAEYVSPYLNDATLERTSDENIALAALMNGVDQPGLARKLGTRSLLQVHERIGDVASGATGTAKFIFGRAVRVEAVYVQAASMVANVTANVLKAGTSVTSTAAAVGLTETTDSWQRIPLDDGGVEFDVPASLDLVDDAAEGLTVTMIADGSGSVTTGRVAVFYSEI